VEEMVNMIIAQRAYEVNSKAIQTSDEMLAAANNLRR
jgi:flagellar basal-body rod protein FlgG